MGPLRAPRRRDLRHALTALVVALGACTSGDDGAACAPLRPDEVRRDVPTPEDLAEVLPRPRLDPDDVRPARAWGDLDGDGDDDLIGDDAPPELSFVWHDDLDGEPGEDVASLDAGTGTTKVWSGRSVLDGSAEVDEPDLVLEGLPRAVARLEEGGPRETLLVVPDPPAIRFVDPRRPELHLGGDPAREVEHVVVFEEDGQRRIGLRIDHRFATWPVPDRCPS